MSWIFWVAFTVAIFAGVAVEREGYGVALYFSLMVIVLSAEIIAKKLKK